MTDPEPNLPELYRVEQAPSFHVSSITRDAGSMSPFGDHLEFPLPVETFPLAICDARSISPDDFVVNERRYPNRIGQTYVIGYNPDHKWFWFPRQARDEALVFKVYDSAKDGRARWTAHTAFDDPTTPPNARPRESIEIRTLAFF